ncbi:putative AsnC family transcriptional regulator [Caenibius tardaugens NBRC 16725]|uniref:Putative AsnC family transcriptional regulator n=2 Tax=Caenibius TaxID=2827482 RepID=U2YMP7_9SPHN|nr:Lrp/AsnC family transcriptional regulator [Caenibius tardaugens NBRC 16725]GAD50040.1 putative AsnC family transcriptional regulator [Caenibius tardaugens NBRC 16725]
MPMDRFDRAIIAALQDDARMPIAEIAERVSLSATPVSRRLKHLEEDGIIRGYAPILDMRKLGFELDAYVLINLETHNDENIDRFEQEILSNPYVVSCNAVTGDMDYLLHVIARNVDHLNQSTLKALVRIPGVRDVKSIIALEAIKSLQSVPLD